MNPLTQIKNTQKITKREIELGLFEKASWHARFAHSAYIFAGGLDYDLTEGDLLAVFAQYGELVDVHLVRNKTTGKSQGFAFLAYEDQRSTVLAVDNLSGAVVAGRKIRVEHVDNYKKRKAELEGEDPDAIPDEPPAKQQRQQQQGNGPHSVTAAGAEQFGDESPPAVVETGRGGGALGAGRLGDTWQAPNSLFALLAEAKPAAPAAAAAAAAHKHKEKKEKKDKKEKKEKKEKHKHRDKDRSCSRSRSRSRSRSPLRKAPSPQQQPVQRAAVGPPRPPAALQQHRQQQQQEMSGPDAGRHGKEQQQQQRDEDRGHGKVSSRHDSRDRDRHGDGDRKGGRERSRDRGDRDRDERGGDRNRHGSSGDNRREDHRQQGSRGRDGLYDRRRSRSRSR